MIIPLFHLFFHFKILSFLHKANYQPEVIRHIHLFRSLGFFLGFSSPAARRLPSPHSKRVSIWEFLVKNEYKRNPIDVACNLNMSIQEKPLIKHQFEASPGRRRTSLTV